MEVKSPVTGSSNVIKERDIHCSFIIEKYQAELSMDVSRFFKGLTSISIYLCKDTGYRFYHPFTIDGDDAFYQQLEKFPWYYMDWKWEHGITENLIKKDDKVLELGCAHGTFLKKIKSKGASVEGLELNSAAVKDCKDNGLAVHPETIEKFSTHTGATYDMVCSFQVLEHIRDIKAFIDASLKVLKPGGRMVVCIPNNDSLILKNEDRTLNMPPHHMGLWTMNSLVQLQNHFPMRLDGIYLEPLQSYHYGFAHKLALPGVMTKIRQKMRFLSPLMTNLARRFAFLGINNISDHIIGHSILVVYRKNHE
jgi:2-polyprenyl-3-methyl-5-hydroxy-6-metoxy-1,4-benzoquinol methylase